MDELTAFTPLNTPTATRPLLGHTVLAVEDSRYACDALRLMCLKSGARIRRADCLSAAKRHLRAYRPSILIVDIGLPDGSGLDLIKDMQSFDHGIKVVLAISGDDTHREAALSAGAHGFLQKPILSLSEFQDCLLNLLPPELRPSHLRVVPRDQIKPDPIALQDDLRQAAAILAAKTSDQAPEYLGKFLSGVARSAGDVKLKLAAERYRKLGTTKGYRAQTRQDLRSILDERLASGAML